MTKESTSGVGYQIKRIVGRGKRYLAKNGFKATVKRFFVREKKKLIYKKYLLKVTPHYFELERMREEQNKYMTKFSIIIPVYRTNPKLLQDLIDSLLGQVYRNFEVCFADASGRNSETEKIICAAKACDPRIKYKLLDENLGISGNTNEAIVMSSGDFLVFMDQETYEQIEISKDRLKWEIQFLKTECIVEITSYEGEILGINLPPKVALKIVECEAAVRGDTVNKAMKNAKLETGLEIKVPLFIENGE